MKIYDISQEFFTSRVFPGDPAPVKSTVSSIADGAVCNLTAITCGSHNGTHMDAPKHFCAGGKAIDEIDLERCVGKCKLIELSGKITAEDIADALDDGTVRLLIKGDIEITLDGAKKMTELGLMFLGVEGLTVGPMSGPMAVHLELLGHEVAILEGCVMAEVPTGDYFLAAQPIKYGGIDGAPVRPLLISLFE